MRSMANTVSFEELAATFHLSLPEAAKKLGIGSTALKRVCRKHNIPRWPFRRLRGLDTMIRSLQGDISRATTETERQRLEQDLQYVLQQKESILRPQSEGGTGGTYSSRALETTTYPSQSTTSISKGDLSHGPMRVGSYSRDAKYSPYGVARAPASDTASSALYGSTPYGAARDRSAMEAPAMSLHNLTTMHEERTGMPSQGMPAQQGYSSSTGLHFARNEPGQFSAPSVVVPPPSPPAVPEELRERRALPQPGSGGRLNIEDLLR